MSCLDLEDDTNDALLGTIVRKTLSQNTTILIKSASCSPGSPPHLRSSHGPNRFPVLESILAECLETCPFEKGTPGKRIVIAVQGRKDLETTSEMIRERFAGEYDDEGGCLVHGLEGHADMLEFSKIWNEAFLKHRIILTSAQCLLYLFFHGVLRMDMLSHLFFDDCTMANSNHPYCQVMNNFYLPVRAKLLAEAAEAPEGTPFDELGMTAKALPRIITLADWPLVSDTESFLTKRDRIAKLLQYLRLFQTVIRPLESDLKAPEGHDWLSFEELVYLKDAGCFEQLQAVYLEKGKSSLTDRLECIFDLIVENRMLPTGNQANVLVLVKSESVTAAERLIPQLARERDLDVPFATLTPASMATARGSILLLGTGEGDLQLLAYYLQQQTLESLSIVYVAEPCLAPWLLLTLMAYAKQMPICSIRSQGAASLHEQAVEMALWAVAIGASSPVDSAPFRKLRAFVGGYEAVAKSAYLLSDDSPIHHWIRSSSALISTATSITILLGCCSYLPHIGSSGTGLRIHTMAVKRVSSEGKELDKERHFYMTRISLPPCLEPWVPADRLHIQGPLTPSRLSSQTLAANGALKLLHECNVLNDNLLITEPVLSQLFSKEISALGSTRHDLEYNPFDNEEVNEDDLASADQIQELAPCVFQNGPEWKDLEPVVVVDESKMSVVDLTDESDDEPGEEFYCYAFEYAMTLLDEKERYKPVGIRTSPDESIILQEEDLLPADTLIHLTDESFINSSGASRTFALVTRKPVVLEIRPVELRIGATVLLRGTLTPIKGDGKVMMTAEQVSTLKAFQAVTFGLISVRQYVLNQNASEPMDEDEDAQMGGFTVPGDKQFVYFCGLLKKDTANDLDFLDMERTLEAYGKFIQSQGQRIGSQLQAERDMEVNWTLDWESMERATGQEHRINLQEYIVAIEKFQLSHAEAIASLGPTPVFPYPNDPSRDPLSVDFMTFALRRLSLYAPYNGMFYRAKLLEPELTPQSPFESQSAPGCSTYAEYVRMKYGLNVQHPDSQLVQVKRIEGFASLSKWLMTSSRSQTNKKRHRMGRHEQTKSDLIPELVEIIPIPYALVRMAILLPKAVYDLERQALIHDFYAHKLPSYLKHVQVKLEPSTILVDSLTGPTSALTYDFERLEILGDSFLKLISSIDVFLTCPLSNEGGLSTRRQDKICNANLYKIAIDMSLHRYARLTPFFAKLWCPPDIITQFDEEMKVGFPFIPHIFDAGEQRWKLVWTADERAGKRSALYHLYPDGTLEDRSKEGERVVLVGALRHLRHKSAPSNTPVLSRFGHAIPPKAMADLVESCIGAVYKAGGYQVGIDLLLGLDLVSEAMLSHRDIDSNEALGRILGGDGQRISMAPKPIVTPSMQQKFSDVAPYVPSEENFPYEQVEEILGYKFKCRRLLFVALTHSSVDVTNSNERLEWLGDAVLDWIITEHYYEQYKDEKWMTPARITACRQAAVCNEAFSRLTVHCGLQKYLRIDSGFLQLEIEQYVKAVMAVEDGPDAADPEGPLSALSWNTRYTVAPGHEGDAEMPAKTKEQDVIRPQLTIPPAPKAIGDLFEGVAGAVFIDLAFDVDAFARIYLPLIHWYLYRHADPYDLPENPISDFWHDYMAAGVPPTSIEFRYCQPEEVQQKLFHQGSDIGNVRLPEKASTATCQVLVRGRLVAEATAPTKVLARKFATRQAVIYIRSSGWRDFLS